MNNPLSNCTGIVFDIDGVLTSAGRPLPGAIQTVAELRSIGLPFRLLTNDAYSTRTARAISLRALGFDVKDNEVFTATYLAADYLRACGAPPALVLCDPAALSEFEGLSTDAPKPQVVIVGDMFDCYSKRALDAAFAAVTAGAQLLAMQKNRYCAGGIEGDDPVLDVGLWVAGLEYCTGVTATVLGKPAQAAYRRVLEDMGCAAHQTVFVSDDLCSDLAGARAVGMNTVHVLTTVSSERAVRGGAQFVVGSVDELRPLIKAVGYL